MSELINGRTPEEIKRWVDGRATCNTCPKEHEVGCEYGERTEDCQMTIDTIAYIEHLESERDAALAKVPKWISVEDRLPENKKETADCYLVTDGAFIWMAYWGCKEWQFAQCTDSPYVIDWTDITHWMPLPEPPKEEEK